MQRFKGPSDVSFLHSAFGNATCTFFPFFYYHFPPLNCIVLGGNQGDGKLKHRSDVGYIKGRIEFQGQYSSKGEPCYWINFPRSKLIFPRPTAMVGRRKNRAAAQPAVRTPSIPRPRPLPRVVVGIGMGSIHVRDWTDGAKLYEPYLVLFLAIFLLMNQANQKLARTSSN
jgi:hypothetical protein